MAYIDVLKQPTVGQVDSLIGIIDDKVVQIDSKDSCLSGLSNLTDVQADQVREAINALEDEAGVIDTEHLATKSVTHNKIATDAVFAENIANGNIVYSHLDDNLKEELSTLNGLIIMYSDSEIPAI